MLLHADAETRRILTRYRRLVLLGKAHLPLETARRLVGPDCAYHLYFRHGQSRRQQPHISKKAGNRGRARRHTRQR